MTKTEKDYSVKEIDRLIEKELCVLKQIRKFGKDKPYKSNRKKGTVFNPGFSAVIVFLSEINNLTIADIAEKLLVNEKKVRLWRFEKATPSFYEVVKLCVVFKLHPIHIPAFLILFNYAFNCESNVNNDAEIYAVINCQNLPEETILNRISALSFNH